MVTAVIEQYLGGKITAGYAAIDLMQMIDPAHPERVLQGLPTDILIRIQVLSKEFRPQGMLTNYGILPAQDQVEAARKWIGSNANLAICVKDES